MTDTIRDKFLTEMAYERIKRGIITCALEPGQPITEEQLAASYAVGRAGVRAALKRLCQENLVRVASRKRYIVTPVTLKYVAELFELRALLEPVAARLAAGELTSKSLQQLRELCDVQYTVGDHESAAAFLESNTQIHAIIATTAGNSLMAEVIHNTLDKVERVHHMAHLLHDRNALARHEHHELVDSLAAGDGALAERLMAQQIQTSKLFVLETMVASPRLQSVNVSIDRSQGPSLDAFSLLDRI